MRIIPKGQLAFPQEELGLVPRTEVRSLDVGGDARLHETAPADERPSRNADVVARPLAVTTSSTPPTRQAAGTARGQASRATTVARVPRATSAAGAAPARAHTRPIDERIPDARDGLTRLERVVLWQLSELEKERPGRDVSSAQLYGRVVEHIHVTPDELQRILARLGGRRDGR